VTIRVTTLNTLTVIRPALGRKSSVYKFAANAYDSEAGNKGGHHHGNCEVKEVFETERI
jgi:hypothetical protein